MYIGIIDNNVSFDNINIHTQSIQPITTYNKDITSVGKKLTQLSLDLTAFTLHDENFIKKQKIKPALIIFKSLELEKITDELVNSIALDTVYFSSIDYDKEKYWMLGSVQSVIKILRPAHKILDLDAFKTENGHITDSSAKYFQLAWLAHRIGLKVYEP